MNLCSEACKSVVASVDGYSTEEKLQDRSAGCLSLSEMASNIYRNADNQSTSEVRDSVLFFDASSCESGASSNCVHRITRQGRGGSVLVSQMEFLTFGAVFFSAAFSRLACSSEDTCSSGCGVMVWGPTVARQDEGQTPAAHLLASAPRGTSASLSLRYSVRLTD